MASEVFDLTLDEDDPVVSTITATDPNAAQQQHGYIAGPYIHNPDIDICYTDKIIFNAEMIRLFDEFDSRALGNFGLIEDLPDKFVNRNSVIYNTVEVNNVYQLAYINTTSTLVLRGFAGFNNWAFHDEHSGSSCNIALLGDSWSLKGVLRFDVFLEDPDQFSEKELEAKCIATYSMDGPIDEGGGGILDLEWNKTKQLDSARTDCGPPQQSTAIVPWVKLKGEIQAHQQVLQTLQPKDDNEHSDTSILSDVTSTSGGVVSMDSPDFKQAVYIRTTIVPTFRIAHNGSSSYNSKVSTGMVGLENLGATCYLNGVIQMLYHIPRFRYSVYQIPHSTESIATSSTLALQSVFKNLQCSDYTVSPKDLTVAFGWTSLDAFQQQDAQEMLRVLLDKLETKMIGTAVEGTIHQMFSGNLRSYIKCMNVDMQSNREEEFSDLQLDVKGCKDIYDSFRKYIEKEKLCGENKYDAGPGLGKQDAEKGAIFLKFPPVLTLQLKRFDFDLQELQFVKIHDEYKFPETLVLDEFLAEDAEGYDPLNGTASIDMNKEHASKYTYVLHSILVQDGEVGAGHYYAYIRPANSNADADDAMNGDSNNNNDNTKSGNFEQWYRFNDEKVIKVSRKESVDYNYGKSSINNSNASAYMLMYLQKNVSDAIMKTSPDSEVLPTDLIAHLEAEAQIKKKADGLKNQQTLYQQVYYCVDKHVRSFNNYGNTGDLVDASWDLPRFTMFKRDVTYYALCVAYLRKNQNTALVSLRFLHTKTRNLRESGVCISIDEFLDNEKERVVPIEIDLNNNDLNSPLRDSSSPLGGRSVPEAKVEVVNELEQCLSLNMGGSSSHPYCILYITNKHPPTTFANWQRDDSPISFQEVAAECFTDQIACIAQENLFLEKLASAIREMIPGLEDPSFDVIADNNVFSCSMMMKKLKAAGYSEYEELNKEWKVVRNDYEQLFVNYFIGPPARTEQEQLVFLKAYDPLCVLPNVDHLPSSQALPKPLTGSSTMDLTQSKEGPGLPLLDIIPTKFLGSTIIRIDEMSLFDVMSETLLVHFMEDEIGNPNGGSTMSPVSVSDDGIEIPLKQVVGGNIVLNTAYPDMDPEYNIPEGATIDWARQKVATIWRDLLLNREDTDNAMDVYLQKYNLSLSLTDLNNDPTLGGQEYRMNTFSVADFIRNFNVYYSRPLSEMKNSNHGSGYTLVFEVCSDSVIATLDATNNTLDFAVHPYGLATSRFPIYYDGWQKHTKNKVMLKVEPFDAQSYDLGKTLNLIAAKEQQQERASLNENGMDIATDTATTTAAAAASVVVSEHQESAKKRSKVETSDVGDNAAIRLIDVSGTGMHNPPPVYLEVSTHNLTRALYNAFAQQIMHKTLSTALRDHYLNHVKLYVSWKVDKDVYTTTAMVPNIPQKKKEEKKTANPYFKAVSKNNANEPLAISKLVESKEREVKRASQMGVPTLYYRITHTLNYVTMPTKKSRSNELQQFRPLSITNTKACEVFISDTRLKFWRKLYLHHCWNIPLSFSLEDFTSIPIYLQKKIGLDMTQVYRTALNPSNSNDGSHSSKRTRDEDDAVLPVLRNATIKLIQATTSLQWPLGSALDNITLSPVEASISKATLCPGYPLSSDRVQILSPLDANVGSFVTDLKNRVGIPQMDFLEDTENEGGEKCNTAGEERAQTSASSFVSSTIKSKSTESVGALVELDMDPRSESSEEEDPYSTRTAQETKSDTQSGKLVQQKGNGYSLTDMMQNISAGAASVFNGIYGSLSSNGNESGPPLPSPQQLTMQIFQSIASEPGYVLPQQKMDIESERMDDQEDDAHDYSTLLISVDDRMLVRLYHPIEKAHVSNSTEVPGFLNQSYWNDNSSVSQEDINNHSLCVQYISKIDRIFITNAHESVRSCPVLVQSFSLIGNGARRLASDCIDDFPRPVLTYMREDDTYEGLTQRIGILVGESMSCRKYRLAIVRNKSAQFLDSSKESKVWMTLGEMYPEFMLPSQVDTLETIQNNTDIKTRYTELPVLALQRSASETNRNKNAASASSIRIA